MPSKSSLIARALVILVALFGLLVGYYWIHKPSNLAVLTHVGGALLDLATVAALFGIAGGIGRAALVRLDLNILTRAERVALEDGIGVGIDRAGGADPRLARLVPSAAAVGCC